MAPLEIHIPTTHVATDTRKPYTLYSVQLSLPLRNHVVQKRYSEFTDLDTNLKSETSQPPPQVLPSKSWLRSTISSEALTETRRHGLETYLQAILSDPNSTWRSSTAWRTFLNLPQTTQSSSTSTTPTPGSAALDSSSWLTVHNEIKSQIHAARSALSKRATSDHPDRALDQDARASLLRAATGIARCEEFLRSSTATTNVSGGGGTGAGELRRRRDLLTATRREVESLETMLRARSTRSLLATTDSSSARGLNTGSSGVNGDGAGDAAALFSGSTTAATHAQQARRSGRVLGGPLKEETNATRELDNAGVLALQKQTMANQDQDVLQLGQAVARMKDMGMMINEELVVQNEMLNMVEGDVDRVQGKVDVAKKRIAKIK